MTESVQKTEEGSSKGIMEYKKVLITFASIIVLLIVGAGFTSVASSKAKPISVVEIFENAIVKGNVKQVMELAVPGDPLFIIDESSAQLLIAYYKANPSSFTDEMKRLKFDAEMWNDEISMNLDPSTIDDLLSLVKRKEKEGLFGKYAIEIKPSYFKVMTNQKGTVFYLNDKEILTAKVDDYDKILGPFMPGNYELKVDYEGDYVSLSSSRKVKLPEDHDKDIDLSLKAQYIYPESNDLEAQLYVNDKDTGITFEHMNRFGPVASDGSLTVHAQKKTEWGTLYSEKIRITDESIYPYLHLEGIYIYPSSNFADAKLLINDKNTRESLEYMEYDGYGPLPLNTVLTMQAEKEFPWGTYRSEIKPIKESLDWEEQFLRIDPLDHEIREQLMNDINTFISTMLEGYTHGNPEKLQHVTGSLREEFETYIIPNSAYTGSLTKVVYDLYGMGIYTDDSGQYNAHLSTTFTANELYDGYEYLNEYVWDITAVYDETSKQWNVDQYNENYYYFDDTDTKEFTF